MPPALYPASAALPVEMVSAPLAPPVDEPAFMVKSATLPLVVAGENPPRIDSAPPAAACDRPPNALAVAPTLVDESPASTATLPAVPAPDMALPVARTTLPDVPVLDVPVDRVTLPLAPLRPALGVERVMPPLLVCEPLPLSISTVPPAKRYESPAASVTVPPVPP
jgi:hypothetical protein